MPSSAPRPRLIYTLSLHDALPISPVSSSPHRRAIGLVRDSKRKACASERFRHRSEEHTSELQSLRHLVCRLLLPVHALSTLFPYTTLFRSRQFLLPLIGEQLG